MAVLQFVVRWRIAAALAVATVMVASVGLAAQPPDGHLGAPAVMTTETTTVTMTATATYTETVSTEPTSLVPTSGATLTELPEPTLLPSPTASPTASPTLTPTPAPTVAPSPHNKAHGLKDACLVQKKKWLILQPCKAIKALLALISEL